MIKTDKEILEQRAKELAEPRVLPVLDQSDKTDVVEFAIYPDKYMINSRFVSQVITLKEVTPIPGTPEFVLGVINFGGRIISVLNIRLFLNLKQKGLKEADKVIVLASDKMEFGILTNGILGSYMLCNEDIKPIPHHSLNEYAKGITDSGIIMLDVEKLLSSPSIIVNHKK